MGGGVGCLFFLLFFFWGGVGSRGVGSKGVRLGGQGGCERRIEVFVKIKKNGGGGGSGGGIR